MENASFAEDGGQELCHSELSSLESKGPDSIGLDSHVPEG